IDTELLHRLFDRCDIDLAFICQRLERRHRDVVAIDLEVLTQLSTRIAPPIAIGTKHDVSARHPLTDLIGHHLHIVCRRHEWPFAIAEAFAHVRSLWRLPRMQQVVTLNIERFATQFGEARDTEYIRLYAVFLLQDLGCKDNFPQDRAGAEQVDPQLSWARALEQVHSFENALLGTLRHGQVRVVLVQAGDVIEDVLLVGIHATQAILHDDGQLVRERRIVRATIGHDREHQVTVTVLMLQALARERRASGGAADQETARLNVARGPDEIADALEPEHGVIQIERDHAYAIVGVSSTGGDPGADRSRLVDAFLENLTFLVFLVKGELIGVLRRVELAGRRIDTDLPEHAFHAERARLIRNDGHDVL